MSLPDFYRYVHGYDKDHIVPNVRGKYEKFGFKEPMDHGMIELYRYFCVDYHGNKAHYAHTLYVFITYYYIVFVIFCLFFQERYKGSNGSTRFNRCK